MSTAYQRRLARRPMGGPSVIRRAVVDCIFAQTIGVIKPQVLINGGLMSLFILFLGGSKMEVGAVFTMNFVAQIVRIVAAPYVDVVRRKWMVILFFSINSLLFGGIFLLFPFLPTAPTRLIVWGAILIFWLQRMAANVGASSWGALICDFLPAPLRGRFFGRMRAALQTTSLLSMLIAGWYLGEHPDAAHFAVVMAFLFVFSAVRPLLLLRLPDPPRHAAGRAAVCCKTCSGPCATATIAGFCFFGP